MYNQKNPLVVILTAIVTVIFTVLILNHYNYIKHSKPEDAMILETFTLLADVPGREQYLSGIPSNMQAYCINGYLTLESKTNEKVFGLLVDKKKRSVHCEFRKPKN